MASHSHGAVGERDDRDAAGRELREGAVVHLLVALVLDGDGDEAAVGGERDRVGLAAEVAGGGLGAGGEVDGGEAAGGLGEARAGVDADEGGVRRGSTTAVGSPSKARLPSGAGAAGSAMSMKPTALFGLSV